MKTLIPVLALMMVFGFHARAEPGDAGEGGTMNSVVTCLTNEPGVRDLEDVLGLNVYKFNIHRSSATNGLRVSVVIVVDKKPSKTVAHLDLDRVALENERAGDDIEVLVAVNPVGSLDGDGILSAKRIRCFLSEAGVKTSGIMENPFYKCKAGPAIWQYPSRESAGVFKIMESGGGDNSTGLHTKLLIRIREF